MKFKSVNIIDLLDKIGEDQVTAFLSSFSCPQSADIENFLKYKAIGFARQGIAATYIVLADGINAPAVAGYFSLANKVILVDLAAAKNSDWRRGAQPSCCGGVFL